MTESLHARERFRVGGFVVEPPHNRISRDGVSHNIEPKVMEVLCVLAAREGEVLSRQALIDAVWGVAYGGDESLTRAVSLLRKALKPHAGEAELIRTVPKRGYSLAAGAIAHEDPPPAAAAVAPVRKRPGPVWAAAGVICLVLVVAILMLWPRAPGPQSEIEGVVVLVQPVVSPASAAESDVLTNDLTVALARFNQIRVRKAAQEAGPDPEHWPDPKHWYVYALTATAVRQGGQTRLRVQLQDNATHETLWSGEEAYSDAEGPDSAVSTLAAELHPAILKAAKTEVQKKPPITLSPWELVLLGTWVPGADREWPGPPTKDSYWVWERAIAKRPDFAMAHGSLAQVMANFALFDPPSNTAAQRRRAAQSAERALELAPYDAGVLYQVALYYKYAGRREQAQAALRRVLDLEPDNLLARIELEFVTGQCTARSVDAIAHLQALHDSLPAANPAHWVLLSRMADMSLARGDYARARDYAGQSRQIVRQVWSSITLAAADAALGDTVAAAQIGGEHDAQWPALDYTGFAGEPLTRWCLGGDTGPARAAFLKLGAISKQP